MSRDEGSAATVLLAFMVGAIGGAALALLFAPATGDETRKLLKEKAREGRDRANEALEKGREVLSEAIERGREVYERTRREGA